MKQNPFFSLSLSFHLCYCSDSHLELPLTSLLRLIVRIGYFTIVTQAISLPRLQKVSSNSRHAGRKLFRNDWTLIMPHNRNFIIRSITIHLYLSRRLTPSIVFFIEPQHESCVQIYISHTRISFILITLDKISLLFFLFEHFATRTKKYKIKLFFIIILQVFPPPLSFSLQNFSRFLFGLIIISPVFRAFACAGRYTAAFSLYIFLSVPFFFSLSSAKYFSQYSYTQPVLFFIYIIFWIIAWCDRSLRNRDCTP